MTTGSRRSDSVVEAEEDEEESEYDEDDTVDDNDGSELDSIDIANAQCVTPHVCQIRKCHAESCASQQLICECNCNLSQQYEAKSSIMDRESIIVYRVKCWK